MLISGVYVLVLQSAKTNLNVEEVFFSMARDIKQRLAESDSRGTEVCIYFLVIINNIDLLFPPPYFFGPNQ